LSYGTKNIRVGSDSQLKFGNCALCLHFAQEPMATPSGHIYCRECILEYILKKTKELKRYRAAYELQNEQIRERKLDEDSAKEQLKIEHFVKKQSGEVNLPQATAKSSSQLKTNSTELTIFNEKSNQQIETIKRKIEESDETKKKKFILKQKQSVDATSIEENREILKRSSFWLPSHAPEHIEKTLEPPDAQPRSPMSNNFIRAKNLIPVCFTVDKENKKDPSVICAVSRTEINHQPAVLLAKSGQVILKSTADEFVVPSMICPMTGAKLKKSDLVDLVKSVSGFSASGKVEANKYQPVMM